MEKHKWEKTWQDNKFKIETLTPSLLVSKYENLLKKEDEVLDIGCGNGRNSIYLGSKGCKISCFDVADLDWQKNLPESVLGNIDFKKASVTEYHYKTSQYRAIILARVIHYLNKTELSFLINKIRDSLTPDGFLLLSYNTEGGIFNQKGIDVPKYSYSIDQMEILLKNIFGEVIISEGSKRNQHVNYESDIRSFDIFASAPHSGPPIILKKEQ